MFFNTFFTTATVHLGVVEISWGNIHNMKRYEQVLKKIKNQDDIYGDEIPA